MSDTRSITMERAQGEGPKPFVIEELGFGDLPGEEALLTHVTITCIPGCCFDGNESDENDVNLSTR
ncbi:MAG: hypothetical protein ABR532_07885 [Candidatus Dormibacteria bacterium]